MHSLHVNTALNLHCGQLADVTPVGRSVILGQESEQILRLVKQMLHTLTRCGLCKIAEPA